MDVLVIIVGDETPQDEVLASLMDDRLSLEIMHASTSRDVNKVVQEASPSDVIVFMSPYTQWHKDALHTLCNQLNDNIVAAMPEIKAWQLARRRPTLGDALLMRLPAGFLGFSVIKNRLNYYLRADVIQHPSFAACAIKRDIYARAGGMDEDFEDVLMDADLGLRLCALGHIGLEVDADVVFTPSKAWRKHYLLDDAPLWRVIKKLTTFSDKWGVHWW